MNQTVQSPLMHSPVASPRSKATRISMSSSEYQMIIHFIKTNMKLFLRLISSDIHIAEVSLSANEFNTLRILFQVEKLSSSKPNLSSITPFFTTHAAKVSMNVIADWLMSIISSSESDDVVYLQGLIRGVTIKEAESLNTKEIRILNCEDSHIYIDGNVNYISIRDCINTTIMVAAVNRVCSIEKCENLNIGVASNFIKISNSVDCTAHIYSSSSPVLTGDSRSITIGPHNVGYTELMGHLKRAKIPSNISNINNWSKPTLMHTEKNCYILSSPKDFFRMILPKKFTETQLLLAPSEFMDAIKARGEAFMDFQNTIKNAKLTNDQEKMLHVAIQGYFREWLVNNNYIKGLTELVKMIDQDFI